MVRQFLKAALLVAPFTFATGCANISPGSMSAIQPTTVATSERVGHAYLFRGFIGVFSTGMNTMGEELKKDGVQATVFQADQWSDVADTIADRYKNHPAEPVVLVGHSYGADNVVRIAQKLKDKDVKIDLLVTLDPVTPPKVPANVVKTVNLYQSNGVFDAMPWLRGIPLEKEADSVAVLNENIRTDRTDLLEPGLNQFNIEEQPKVHAEIEKLVKQVCMTRPQWAMTHPAGAPMSVAAAKPAPQPVPTTQSAMADMAKPMVVLAR